MSDYSPFKGTTGFKRILNATGYSLAGFKAAYQNEAAFRQIVWINIVLIPTTFFVDVSSVEQAVMIAGYIRLAEMRVLGGDKLADDGIPGGHPVRIHCIC